VLEVCVEETVTYFSTIESAEAALEAVNAADQPMAVQGIADRPKTQRRWGE
jgi:carbamoyl-phosphate synthase large subunit